MIKATVIFCFMLAGCAREAEPSTYAIPTASAADIKTALCPQHGPVAKAMAGCREDGDQ